MLRLAQHRAFRRRGPRTNRPPASPVAPTGPAWFGAVMGTSVCASLAFLHGASAVSLVLFALGWLLLVWLTSGFLVRCLREPLVLRESFTRRTEVTWWGMVSMGYLSVGSSTSTVLGTRVPDVARNVDLIMWVIGTVIGLLAAVGFSAMLLKGHTERPLPSWGLPVVAPMVTATVGAQLVPHVPSLTVGMVIDVVATGSFFMALSLGVAVFTVSCAHAWFREPLPLAAAASSFVPLGIVGQSTAAAQSLATAAERVLEPEAARVLSRLSHGYGIVVLLIGVPILLWAATVTYRALGRGMPFTPGWWAMTFPVGTCSLGTYLMGWHALSLALLVLLGVHWCVAATGSVLNVTNGLRGRHAPTAT